MALVACRECKGRVSSEAKRCPHCGAKTNQGTSPLWLIFGIPVGLAAIFLAVGISKSSPEKSKARAAIDLCWDSVDAQPALGSSRELATRACQKMVADFEAKYGRAPSLRHQ